MKKGISILLVLILYGFQLLSQYDKPLNDIALNNYLPTSTTYPFSFVVLGDTRDDGNSPNIDADFIQLMNQIALLNPKPKFVINVGDVVISGTESEYQKYYQFISDWMGNNKIAFFTVPGNHEFYQNYSYSQYYPLYIGNYDFSFDLGNIRIIAINNVQHEDAPLHKKAFSIEPKQLSFVESKLSEQNSPPLKFGFTHVPIIEHLNSSNNFFNYSDYYNLLVNYGAKANFCGHVHKYKRYYLCNGIFDIITGGGGAPTGGETNPPVEHTNHHFLLVTVSEDNIVKVQTYFINEGNNEDAQQYDFVMPTSQDMILQNQIIQSGEERILTAQNTTEVADESVVLKSGFHAKVDSNFNADIQDLKSENVASKSANETKSFGNNNITASKDDIIIDRQTSICVYPNPSDNGIFTLYFYGNKQAINEIEVYNNEGKVIYKTNLNRKYENSIIVDISKQNAGVYLLKINRNNKIITKKIIIN